ncbi:hypothetical protein KEM48_012851 [Puccinia striiformis f. sp. tritici PST-130]|uniref:Succinate dehydrogenase assembly factor 3 n=2 Tax=Puccinia striiformis f. sp. tritici TaxID=168172 RepID=A0A0L0USY0_9BASI|nr:hypothetical protein Pst134EB_021617 [Puccinia striiformis f. sp. tritici]KAI9620231.1 hypothetical protein H4Q26_013800 [Puccinia striiformis f. sp. tritici PST-130]KAI9629557.1 hypothetical protein KEM48_012851 [Puccinia striiformis f. sp. tritici PST-130]KNE90115.1 hypothetical protein PSTG_16420 [Puccinia striiformis f. sp. tritici PST-78]
MAHPRCQSTRLVGNCRFSNNSTRPCFSNAQIRLASSINLSPRSDSSVSLLPPLVLYRRLLRIHRALPIEMRSLGDTYVKDEFRRCRSIDNPIQIIGFLGQWKTYLDNLQDTKHTASSGNPSINLGKKLPEDLLEKLSPEQVGQLFELLKATKEIWVDVDKTESKD